MMLNQTQIGDCRTIMRDWIAQGVKVQMCVTSPPYWGLRDYGVAGQIGLEETYREYIAKMVEVFGLVRDLLADDGVLWLNLGDSYAGSWGAQSREHAGKHAPNISALSANQVKAAQSRNGTGSRSRTPGLKPKDLCLIPARLAIALQAAGWWVRQDIIWHKLNPMPESVTDRCTKAHEYLFLLSKSERYYFDADAISEPASHPEGAGNVARQEIDGQRLGQNANLINGLHKVGPRERRNRRSVWTVASEPYAEAHFATFPRALIEPCILAGSRPGDIIFDPFMGSGTTGQVAQDLGRRWLGCELNPAYVQLERKRTAQAALGI